MQGGREMLRGGAQGKSEERAEGERKMDSEADCEYCLMMFIRPESWPQTRPSVEEAGRRYAARRKKMRRIFGSQMVPLGRKRHQLCCVVPLQWLKKKREKRKNKLAKDAYAGVINNARKTADPALRPVPKISWRLRNGTNEPVRQN